MMASETDYCLMMALCFFSQSDSLVELEKDRQTCRHAVEYANIESGEA